MSLRFFVNRACLVVAAVMLLLALTSSASAQVTKNSLRNCTPCGHPYYGYYPTCWTGWPAGWNCWNCGLAMPPAAPTSSQIEAIPPPELKNGIKPELIPPPTPEPKSQLPAPLQRLLGRR